MYKHWYQWEFILCHFWGKAFVFLFTNPLVCITNVFTWSGFKCCQIFNVIFSTSCFLYWIHLPTQFRIQIATCFNNGLTWQLGNLFQAIRYFSVQYSFQHLPKSLFLSIYLKAFHLPINFWLPIWIHIDLVSLINNSLWPGVEFLFLFLAPICCDYENKMK